MCPAVSLMSPLISARRQKVRSSAATQRLHYRRAELKHKALTSAPAIRAELRDSCLWISNNLLAALFQAARAWISAGFAPPDMDGPPLAESEACSLVQ